MQDVHRTYGEDQIPEQHGREEALRRVLVAFVYRNPTIGYFQGLNFIAATLLNNFSSEEAAFWELCNLIEARLPVDFFARHCGGDSYPQVLCKNITEFIAELQDKMAKLNIALLGTVHMWFISLFTTKIQCKVARRPSCRSRI